MDFIQPSHKLCHVFVCVCVYMCVRGGGGLSSLVDWSGISGVSEKIMHGHSGLITNRSLIGHCHICFVC